MLKIDLSSNFKLEDLPFTLRFVKSTSLLCGICHWTEKCTGCLIPADETPVYFLMLRCLFIAVEWNSSFILENIDTTNQNWIEHNSIKEGKALLSRTYQLSECLELLSQSDQLKANCTRCTQDTLHSKRFAVQDLPITLVLHLKRFKFTTNEVFKMQNTISFPLYGLDMKPYVAFPKDG
jgi:uncharacterized UBP type Zn finger protein